LEVLLIIGKVKEASAKLELMDNGPRNRVVVNGKSGKAYARERFLASGSSGSGLGVPL
jgi:hypothetical protein